MKIEKEFLVVVRYLVLLSLMFSIGLIYFVFSLITIGSVVFILRLFFENVSVSGSFISIGFDKIIEIVPACVAGSAYLLLLILNLSVRMDWVKRVKSILFSFFVLFVLNVVRIVFLTWMYVGDNVLFDFSHKLLWYGLSSVFVVGIWFWNVKLFKIKEIPVYSDVRFLVGRIRGKKVVGKKIKGVGKRKVKGKKKVKR
ncbi:pacearchaeosortase [archaeon]|jgi:exosortase/archaeosortase family protein|nr:pacearchaeosortase [archaeon]